MKDHNILDLIGNTPLIRSKKIITNNNISLYLKLEGNNPGGSIKDRPAYYMIKKALERKEITKDTKLIEATSGNTGIALAMIAGAMDLEIEIVMPDDATAERVKTMKAYGAKVILTPAADGIEASRDYAEKKVENEGYFMLDQYSNEDNWKAHYKTTGPEIWNDTDGKITHFVSAMGTTGTIMGISACLKEMNPEVQIIGAQPTEKGGIPGIRKWPVEYLPKIYQPERIDQLIEVSKEEAVAMTRRLAEEEGILAGMSSGGAVAIAEKLARTLKAGTIVAIICDRGDRYLSSDLFS
jgi:cysteine synthase B